MPLLPSLRPAAFSLLSLPLWLLLAPVAHADLIPYIADQAYDDGDFGAYPNQEFRSSSLRAPRVNLLQTSERCDDDGAFVFLNPRGHEVVPGPNPMILDSAGNLVWTLEGKPFGETYNLNVQEWKGEQYLTFWGGNDAVGGHGQGNYYLYDSTYTKVREISSVGPIKADLHEFRFTPNGTALLTVYEITPADLSPLGGPEKGWVWDGVLQEIDLETGQLLFTWKSTDHYTVNETYHGYTGGGNSKDSPFDYFHINSIDKDDKGNYLISARYTHSVTYIDGRTGDVLWQLGGKRNSFKDESDGRATNFEWQHDARWHDNGTTITLFDNGAEAGHYTSEYSRGMRIQLDQEAMTARLLTEYINPQKILSSSQGSVQVLDNGNVLLGYGYNGAYTEFTANGMVLCDTHFGSAHRFESGDVQSYRVQKARWVGRPSTQPSIKVDGSSVYVSWNGATEVHRWVLQDAAYAEGGDDAALASVDEAWYSVQTVEKTGFETEMRFGINVRRYVRVLALDREGRVLGASLPGGTRQGDIAQMASTFLGVGISDNSSAPLIFLICVGIVATGAVGTWVVLSYQSRWRKAYQRVIDEDREDGEVEMDEEEARLLYRGEYTMGS